MENSRVTAVLQHLVMLMGLLHPSCAQIYLHSARVLEAFSSLSGHALLTQNPTQTGWSPTPGLGGAGAHPAELCWKHRLWQGSPTPVKAMATQPTSPSPLLPSPWGRTCTRALAGNQCPQCLHTSTGTALGNTSCMHCTYPTG